MGSCEPPCGCWDLNPGPSEEQLVFLTTETSLQPTLRSLLEVGLIKQTFPVSNQVATRSTSRKPKYVLFKISNNFISFKIILVRCTRMSIWSP
ncbi:mCG140828 [Mus musculus]|nr:mCG140828 [Mus musculus]